jgi:gamma-glutamyltranspeptidase / glutathione hydrolase
MIVGPHPRTAEAGLEMLRAGGNAFDAAVAAAFTEAVVEPAHNGVAGYGGAAVCFHPEQGVVCLDFNSEAPAAADPGMFLNDAGMPDNPRQNRSTLSVGVPGIVAGLEEIHRSWGTLPLTGILAPAIRAAREGWDCNPLTHVSLRDSAAGLWETFPDTAELLMPGGRVPEPGETMTNPDLGATLEMLSARGLREFYEGETGRIIVASLRERGGILTRDDLASYRPLRLPATRMEYCGRTLHTPPVGSGGVTSLQMLRLLERFDLSGLQPGTAPLFHLFGEVMKACWRRRLTTLGDPAFTGIVESAELEEALIEELRGQVEAGLANPQPGERLAPDPIQCTSHICAADASGGVVSLTQTHGAWFGSWVSVPGTGLVFGHGMARFEPRPGWPNSIAPKKRPLHNMAPFLVTRDGRPAAAYGTPGGRTIVNNQACFSLCLYRFGLDIAATLALPRLHCEEAEPMKLETSAGEPVLEQLRALGHQVAGVERNGGPAHGILLDSDLARMDGSTDPRGNGKVAWE